MPTRKRNLLSSEEANSRLEKGLCVAERSGIKVAQAAGWVKNHRLQSDKGQWEVNIEITVVIGAASPVM